MNDKLRRELEDLVKKGFPGTSGKDMESSLSIGEKVIHLKNPALMAYLIGAMYNVGEMIKGLQKEEVDPDAIAAVLFAMLHDLKPCVSMYLYEALEQYLDRYFHILACSHLADGKCEKGHSIEGCDDTENPCDDRLVEYGTWSAALSCDICPFQEREKKQK